MVTKNLAFRIQADDSDALKSFAAISKSAEREMKKVAQALDDTDSAGKRMADGLKASAAKIDAELTGLRSASGKLAAALGEDFGRSDAEIDGFVQDLRRAGLTFEEIEADADELAAAIRALDDVRLKNVRAGLDDVDDSVRRVGETTDKTKSVVANFAGNAAQELPGVAAAMGPANVAIGQFAEYAAEGDINLKNLTKAIGPMLGATAGLAAANHLMNQWGAATKAAGEMVEDLRDKIVEGQRGIDALRDSWEEAGAVQAAVAKLFGSGAQDVTEKLFKAGLTADSTLQIIEGGLPAARKWREEVVAMGVESEDAWAAFLILGQQIMAVEKAEKNAAVTAAFFRDELVYTQDELAATAKWAEGLAAAYNSIPKSVHTSVTTSGGRAGSAPTATGGARAFGGPVDAGVPYLVGERGPEIVVPRSAGTVIPNNRIGGGDIIVNVGGSVVTERQLIDAIHEGLLRKGRTVATLGFG